MRASRRLLFLLVLLAGAMVVLAPASSGLLQESETLYLPLSNRACESPPASNALALLAGSYLGGAGADTLTSMDVAPDGTVIVAGTMPGYTPPDVTAGALLGGGEGALLRLDPTERRVLSLTRIGGGVNDMEINEQGALAVCGDFGVALLDSSASSVVWHHTPGTGSRCAIGRDGTVAVIAGGQVYTYESGGALLNHWSIGGSAQSDIAVDAASQSIIATGYQQRASELQEAFVAAWNYTGTSRWRNYNFTASEIEAENLGADTRGVRLAMGRDGKLYFAGESNGSNSVFTRDPHSIGRALSGQEWIRTDRYNDPYNNSATITWYGRYDPATGRLEKGQFLLARLSTGRGNTIKPLDIMADEQGRVYVVGETAASIENRDNRQVAGLPVGPYAQGEGFLLIVRPDFRERLVWTPFAGPTGAGGSPLVAVSAREGMAALAGTLTTGTFITHNPFQPTPSTLPDGYVAVFPRSCR